MIPYNSPHVSDKALRDFAGRVLRSSKSELSPGTTDLEIQYFVSQLPSDKLTQIYGMFFNTGMVQ